jgi:hypothetical protein
MHTLTCIYVDSMVTSDVCDYRNYIGSLQMHLLQCSIHLTDKLEKTWVQDTQLYSLVQWKFWWKWFRNQAVCKDIDRMV